MLRRRKKNISFDKSKNLYRSREIQAQPAKPAAPESFKKSVGMKK